MKPVSEVVDFGTAAKSPRVLLATNSVKGIDWRDANPCKVSNTLARRRNSEDRGFESR